MGESGEPSAAPEPSGYEAEARAAGIAAPTASKLNPWMAVGITVVILGASLGIGYSAGWFNPSHPVQPYTHPASCSSPVAELNGSVSSLASPLLNVTFANLTANYTRSTGGCIAFGLTPTSGDAAIGALAAEQTDFVLTSAPLSASQAQSIANPFFLVPVELGAVAVVYDLPGDPAALNLTPGLLAGLYLGTITSWSSPAIADVNPGASLASGGTVTAVHQTGATAVNGVFTNYLAAENTSWNVSVGSGASVRWPVGPGESGDASVLDFVAETPGAIGFVEAGGLAISGVGVARIENPAGAFVAPNATTTTDAAAGAGAPTSASNSAWENLSLLSAPGGESYPIVSFGFVVVYSDLGKAYQGGLSNYDAWWLLTFLEWVANTGQASLLPKGAAPLSGPILTLDGEILTEVSYNGISVLSGPSEEGTETGGETTGEF